MPRLEVGMTAFYTRASRTCRRRIGHFREESSKRPAAIPLSYFATEQTTFQTRQDPLLGPIHRRTRVEGAGSNIYGHGVALRMAALAVLRVAEHGEQGGA